MTIGAIAGCISATAFLPYLFSILRGKTIPSRVTWWIWSLLGILLFLSYRGSGASSSLWVAVVYMVAPILVAILSIRHGVGGWSRFDRNCGIASVMSLFVWIVTGSPKIELLLLIAIDFFGLMPTIKKAQKNPEQENCAAWFLMVAANFLNLFAVETADFFIILYPAYLFISGAVVLAVSLRKMSFLKKK